MFDPVIIKAKTINDAWHQLIFGIEANCRKYLITQGSYQGQYRYEYRFVLVEIERPWEDMVIMFPPGIPFGPPSDKESIEQYFSNYIFNPDLAKDEQYTYGERIAGFKELIKRIVEPKPAIDDLGINIEILPDGNVRKITERTVNQIEEVIKKYKTGGHGNNQCTIEIGMPSDILLPDPPCLRVIDTRIEEDTLHFFVYFRSWDLFSGLPMNLGGIELLKQYMAREIGVDNGKIIAASKGLHIYDHALAYVRIRRGEQ